MRTVERTVYWSKSGGGRWKETGLRSQWKEDHLGSIVHEEVGLFFVFSVLREFIAALSKRTMRSDLCFQIAEAAGSTEAAEEEGSQKFRRTSVEAKQGMRSKWSFTCRGIEGTECSS